MLSKENKTKYVGFSLVEVLVVMFIAAVVFTSFYTTATVGTKYIVESKNKLGAVALANEKMEIIRNLEYDKVGIVGGIPDGNIAEDEDAQANGKFFHVRTFIQYVDDPLDGQFPADAISNDYKIVKVTVSWKDSNGNNQEISSVSRFVPPGLETSDGGAPLAINVRGSDGVAVKQASVHITNTSVIPALNFTVQTDDEGHIMIPAAPESTGGYQISVSKEGYETVQTQSSPALDYLSHQYAPTYAPASVILNTLNMYDYIQDKLAKITIKTTDYQNNPVGGVAFAISGGKVLERDAGNVNVLNVHDSSMTDAAGGQKEYAAISPGNYEISMTPNAQYEFADFSSLASPLAVVPGAEFQYEVKLANKNVNGMLVRVLDNDTNAAVANAKISLLDENGATIFSEKNVSANGILYYPDGATSLSAGAYTLKIEAADYLEQEISVNINKLTQQEVKLIKS